MSYRFNYNWKTGKGLTAAVKIHMALVFHLALNSNTLEASEHLGTWRIVEECVPSSARASDRESEESADVRERESARGERQKEREKI